MLLPPPSPVVVDIVVPPSSHHLFYQNFVRGRSFAKLLTTFQYQWVLKFHTPSCVRTLVYHAEGSCRNTKNVYFWMDVAWMFLVSSFWNWD